jgi:hypothetical protein
MVRSCRRLRLRHPTCTGAGSRFSRNASSSSSRRPRGDQCLERPSLAAARVIVEKVNPNIRKARSSSRCWSWVAPQQRRALRYYVVVGPGRLSSR